MSVQLLTNGGCIGLSESTLVKMPHCSVSARPEFLGVIDDPLFENLGVIGKFRGSELFQCIITFCLSMHQYLRYLKNVPYRKIKVLEIRCMFYYQ